ncbi:MAG: hypothetical protein ACFCVH_21900 [Alphaproteobacteria bacterium]
MSERSLIEERIRKKQAEIQSLERRLEAAKVYVQALNDVLKVFESAPAEDAAAESVLRKGSAVARARDVILREGAPVHIDILLNRLGRKVTRESKASLTGSLAAYVRRGEIFTRPAPNTFGLIELKHFETTASEEDTLPEGFGEAHADTDDDIPF